MITLKKILLILLLSDFLFVHGISYNIQRIDSRDGLSNSAVLSMYQDHNGFMWVGTYSGLNRYDGKFIESFGLDDGDNNVQTSNIIQNIQGDIDNCLWLSTYIGLNKFSIDQNKVIEHFPLYRFPYNLASNGKGLTCLVAKRRYISVYDKFNKVFLDIPSPDIDPLSVKSAFIDNKNDLWVFTNVNHVWRIKVTLGNSLKKIKPSIKFRQMRMSDTQIVAAFEENGLIFYVNTSGDLYSYDIERARNNYIRNISKLIQQYGVISSIVTYHDDFWISFKGSGVLKLVAANKYAEEILDMTSGVFCLHRDNKQDVVWIGSDGQGVIIYSKKTSIFNTINSDAFPVQVKKPIRTIFTDKFNTLWIGTKGDGLLRIRDYDKLNEKKIPATNVTRFATHDGLSNNQIFDIEGSKYYPVNWLATEGPGLSYFSYKDQKVHTMYNPTSTAIKSVHSLVEENDSTLWLATSGYGLLKVIHSMKGNVPVVKSVKAFLFEHNRKIVNDLFSLVKDKNGFLWVGSRGDGVICFRMNDESFNFITSGKPFNTTTDDILTSCRSKNSYFYFGSVAGLLKLTTQEGKSKLVEIPNRNREGMKEMIHGMQEGNSGCIWMSTNRGLVKYNPLNNIFHKYYKNTGLNVIEFSDNADYTCPFSNRIFFGGIDGIVWIEQNIPDDKSISPPVQFTGLKLNGLKKNMIDYIQHDSKKEYLQLSSKQNTFSVSFIAVDFIHGANIEYTYCLENYNNEWVNADDLNEAKFTSLPPGKYILKVKYKNDVFDTESQFYSLAIEILPPWYLTTIAWTIYTLLLLSLMFYLRNYFRKKAQLQQEAFNKSIIEKNNEELYETKLKFFTNITHEFLTPLTLIQGPCERILAYDKTDDYVKKYASLLHLNINRLQLLIHEIINFSKREEFGDNSCFLERIQLNEITKSINLAFSESIERNNIDFHIEITDELYWNTDISCLNKILMNLISNAFKYTPTGGKINISLQIVNDELVIVIYNTGKGIHQDEIKKVFDRFRILDNMEKNVYMEFSSRNGLGLAICYSMIQKLKGKVEVKSEVDHYAEFTVKLPYLAISEEYNDSSVSESNQQSNDIFELSSSPLSNETITGYKKILVVDDNKEIVWMITEMMSDKYEIIKAFSAQEAFDLLDNELPELIVADLMMPGELDGSDLVKRLKTNRFTSHIPIIIISAKNSIDDQIVGLEYGADFYLTKPFNLSYLRTTIDKLIEKKSVLKEYYNSPISAVELKSGQMIHQEEHLFLQEVTQIIDKNLVNGELRPDAIAEQMKLSSQSFYRKLKAISSLSPSDFIKKYRFSLAAKLLISSNLSVQEVIYKVGINNRSYFYREFFKIYNTTPKEYRIMNENAHPDLEHKENQDHKTL